MSPWTVKMKRKGARKRPHDRQDGVSNERGKSSPGSGYLQTRLQKYRSASEEGAAGKTSAKWECPDKSEAQKILTCS